MKIGYVSDTHMDFFIKNNVDKVPAYIVSTLNPQGGDVLIVAGDISHYNDQIKKFLKTMTAFYNHIIFTFGNHELYLVSESQKKKYKKDSFNRIRELEDWVAEETNIYMLNGNTVTIDGITFGGLPHWYDLPTQGHLDLWNKEINDSNLIYEGKEHIKVDFGYYSEKISTFNTQSFRKEQEEKFSKLRDIDVLVTHICPSIIPEQNTFHGYHDDSGSDLFYMTDDFKRVKQTGAKYVVYGHNHTETKWERDGVKFLTNSIGYPSEWKGNNIKYFNIEEK